MELISTAKVREELGRFTIGGEVCHSTWARWRRAAGVEGHTCTRDQWVRLCACLALYRLGQKVTRLSVTFYIEANGDNPIAYIPGLVPDEALPLPDFCSGSDLPESIRRWTGFLPSERTVRRWVESAGLKYSRARNYTRTELMAIVSVFIRARNARRQSALKNLGVA